MGARPKPTALKVIKGTDQPCRVRNDEPKPDSHHIVKPPGLSKKAGRHWNRLVKMLKACKVLTEMDTYALGILCVDIAEAQDMQKQLDETGYIVKGRNGYPVENPLLRLVRQKNEAIRKGLIEFGMTPAARTRVGTVGTEPEDEFDF